MCPEGAPEPFRSGLHFRASLQEALFFPSQIPGSKSGPHLLDAFSIPHQQENGKEIGSVIHNEPAIPIAAIRRSPR